MTVAVTDLIVGGGAAASEARLLMEVVTRATGTRLDERVILDERSAGDDWASSGAMALTGWPAEPPLPAPGAPASLMRAATALLGGLAPQPAALPGAGLLAERAAALRLHRRAPRSANGSFRPLRASDGWIGVTLSRPWDASALPALIEGPVQGDMWRAVATWAAARTSTGAADRAQLLDIACAPIAARPAERPVEPFKLTDYGSRQVTRTPIVLDLTSLWAGPLCAHLLGLCGGRIIKVESTQRPDTGRQATPGFFDLLHGGHESVALDFTSDTDRDRLHRLLRSADIVLESSRPRALRQLGIAADSFAAAGTIWVGISAYGRQDARARVGFGDDVAAAAGLVASDPARELPIPCGDAIADPLSGTIAALAALAAARSGRSCLIDVSMRDVAAWAAAAPAHAGLPTQPAPPVCRPIQAAARPFGADTQRVMSELT
jgi:hypothetical protein